MTTAIRAVVVDDEPAAREAILTFLSDTPNIEVVGEARDGQEALDVIRSSRPDLLFLDVHMPGLSGFDVLDRLGDDVPRGVVLVTAHDEFALRAFDVRAVDYVTKPFGRGRFTAAVDRAVRRLRADEALNQRVTIESLLERLRSEDEGTDESGAEMVASDSSGGATRRLGVRLGNRTTLVPVEEIDWVEADGDLLRLHVGDTVHLLRSTLRELTNRLDPGDFVRIHRSVLVHVARIRTLQREPDGSGAVTLDSGVSLRVARARWDGLERQLGLRGEG
ncbi:MAG: LytTR family DNA-binding domain-containing protein [Gemmatimonadota bacterium]